MVKLSESLKGGERLRRGRKRERENVSIPEGPNQYVLNMWETGGTLSCGWLDEGCMQLCEETGRGDKMRWQK